MKRFLTLALLVALAPLAAAQPYPRGRVAPADGPALKRALAAQGNLVVQAFPPATEPEWDSREHGWVPPVKNQGSCGSCWCFSGYGVVEIAAVKAGKGSAPEFNLSEQYFLDCAPNHGGCNGDDNTTVLKYAKKKGLPFTRAYGPYHAREGQCHFKEGMELFRVLDWGFADPTASQNYDVVTPTKLIKAAIKATGSVGCAVAAGPSWDGYHGGVHHGHSRSIDHDVILVGWKDDASLAEGGYWIMRNSWGPGWGVEDGYMHIAYGADAIGTESVWVLADVAPPPPPPGPDAEARHTGVVVAVVLITLLLAGGVVVLIVLRSRKVD